jgi:hypothetical protein
MGIRRGMSLGISLSPLRRFGLRVVSDPNLVPTRRYTPAGLPVHVSWDGVASHLARNAQHAHVAHCVSCPIDRYK